MIESPTAWFQLRRRQFEHALSIDLCVDLAIIGAMHHFLVIEVGAKGRLFPLYVFTLNSTFISMLFAVQTTPHSMGFW